jgi:hypothetical protein
MKYYFGRHFKFQHQYLDFVPHFFWLYLQVHAFVEYETVEDAEKAVCLLDFSNHLFFFSRNYFEVLW